jgi:L-rhamnono-1,4-lactonase
MVNRILDTHIHLFAKPHLEDLAWMAPDNLLYGNHRLEEYVASVKQPVAGVVFVETDRKSSDTEWSKPIEEFEYVSRVSRGAELPEEGNAQEVGNLLLGIVPWAPVPGGRVALEKYISMLKQSSGSPSFSKVKGFRYLVQDKPKGTMLQSKFIDGIRYLGEQDFAFDLGIDIHSGGIWQLEEAVELAKNASKTVYIVSMWLDILHNYTIH